MAQPLAVDGEGSESRGRDYSERRCRRRDQTHSPVPNALKINQNAMDREDAEDRIKHRSRTIENLLRTHAQGMAALQVEQQQTQTVITQLVEREWN